jgi:SEC-C motif-containing protein
MAALRANPCPCGRMSSGRGGAKPKSLTYADCCQPWHAGAPAPDAEALMRSRYSAFVLGLLPYLRDTWHSSTRPADLTLEPGVQWLGLEVRAHKATDATHAEVAFVARSRVAGRGHRLQERSRFVLESGRWWYVDGDFQ